MRDRWFAALRGGPAWHQDGLGKRRQRKILDAISGNARTAVIVSYATSNVNRICQHLACARDHPAEGAAGSACSSTTRCDAVEFDMPGVMRILATAGLDFAIFDFEHTALDAGTLRRLFAAGRVTGVHTATRPPRLRHVVQRRPGRWPAGATQSAPAATPS
jgi:hypothetical protein